MSNKKEDVVGSGGNVIYKVWYGTIDDDQELPHGRELALWEILKNIYGLYVSSISRYVLLYGSIGSIVFLLIWIYYSVLIFLLGAEISFEIDIGHPL